MRPKREDKFIACLSSDGLQAIIVAQNEVMGQRSDADEHFQPGQVYGTKEGVQSVLQALGQRINTSYIERVNRTLRAHVPGLGRREEGLAKGEMSLRRRSILVMGYYNLCLPHTSLRAALVQPMPTKGSGSAKKWKERTPAMAAGLTDHVWAVKEFLLLRVPPWRQEEVVV